MSLRPRDFRRRSRKGRYIDEAGEAHLTVRGAKLIHELVEELAACALAPRQHVLQLDQAREVNAQLRITPADRLAQHAAAKVEVRSAHLLCRALLADVPIEELQQPSSLRRQLIERAAEHFVRELIGEGDVSERRLDVLDLLGAALEGAHRALVLMQERDRIDQRQVLLVIAPQPRGLIGEGEPLRVRVQHLEGLEQPLRVLVQSAQVLALVLSVKARERPPLALQAMHGLRLLAALIDREHETAVQ